MRHGQKQSALRLYHLHWDNGDDTDIEGFAVVKPLAGEVRVLSTWFAA